MPSFTLATWLLILIPLPLIVALSVISVLREKQRKNKREQA